LKVKLLAIDVDGTLLTDEYSMTERTKTAISNIKKRGVKIILATGRGPKSCFQIMEELDLNDPIITHNGAVIFDPLTKQISLEIGFKAEELIPVIHYSRQAGIHFDLCTAFDMYHEGATKEVEEIYKKFHVNPTLVQDSSLLEEQIVKFTLFGNGKKLDQAMEELLPQFPEWSIIRSGETFIDVIHPQATKGSALNHLIHEYGIDPTDIVAFGNYFNDLEMIQLAGLGVAMANSPLQIQKSADRITTSNNEDGVALIVEELLNSF
jgi:Cof subfamily protein (haloacid dehalogenase superfamily)